MSMYEVIGTNNPAYLLADPNNADIIGINMEPGNGTVARGTIVYKKASGLWAPAAAAQAIITNQLAVLDETVDTTGRATTEFTVAETARAFRAGRFIRGKVTLASAGTVTAAVEVVLREQGIVFEPMVSTAVFDNTVAAD